MKPSMNILVCTDGSRPAEDAVRFAGLLGGPGQARVTILGITERPGSGASTLHDLEVAQDLLERMETSPELVARTGEPVQEIVRKTRETAYDLVVIGAECRSGAEPCLLSARAYAIARAVEPPVLVVTGPRERLLRVLVCTGGREYIDRAVELTGSLASGTGASVTLLHVMAEPPPFFTDLVRREEQMEALLASGSELGRNLAREREILRAAGVPTEVRLRHGIVLDEILAEVARADYDLVVSGSLPSPGHLRLWALGDLTRQILDRAGRPVLVVRPGGKAPAPGWRGLIDSIARSFRPGR